MVKLLYYYTVYINNRKYTIIEQKKYNSLNLIVYKGLPSPSIRKTRQKRAGIVSKSGKKDLEQYKKSIIELKGREIS